METLLIFVIGALFAAGAFLMLRRHMVRLIFGLILISNAANLLIFTMGRLIRGIPPIIPEGQVAPTEIVANPLPQAMILTSIVISFGLMAFVLVLLYQTEQETGTSDVDGLREADVPDDAAPAGRALSYAVGD
jgi:multicomponent Na+:H+ antiporter subunit C